MYTEIECKTPGEVRSKQTLNVDTGADGSLMPITMFATLFARVSFDALAKTIESEISLYTYNNTHIKQFGTCSVHLSFKGKLGICKFYVVEHATVILGISNSEISGLVKVNFDMVDHGIKVVHDVTSDSFRKQIESE